MKIYFQLPLCRHFVSLRLQYDKTKLIKYCLKNNIKNFNGLEITSYQFIEQFKIYNNFYPSLAELKRQIKLFERSK